jgi:hypothetical protein
LQRYVAAYVRQPESDDRPIILHADASSYDDKEGDDSGSGSSDYPPVGLCTLNLVDP